MIEVKNLTVKYGDKMAVDDISFSVNKNEIFGIIGENGAGKTTITECIEGIRTFNKGTITIKGMDPVKQKKEIQHIIGVQLQETTYPKRIKVKELCELFASFYVDTKDYKELIAEFKLNDQLNQYVEKLSGGQRQRLSIILALLHNPEVVFLDELTTGLDPRSRRDMWDYILHLKEKGVTVVMTTHFMDEAEYLCDRLAIFNKGRLVELDTVPNLIKKLDYKEKISFMVKGDFDESILNNVHVLKVRKRKVEYILYGTKGLSDFIKDVLDKNQTKYFNLKVTQPNIEDVFFEFTDREVNY
ncbi:ABC transporter ATP-binding protein [Haloplasma contractile]|uniref:ABC Transporter ATP-binding protein n=1 Tax=Haloplasma contractile SSD-17B TaxID=1033810 RepID=F7Q0P0_9MOLU|nr:ABC transporter ATP-binding protein [Haloplasma contractile]ERJ11950.1 ABC Transporter ATP-binding protein [Haloplasma contractile SSD-17B]